MEYPKYSALGEILLHHLKTKLQGVVKMSDWGNAENVRILLGFAPSNGNMHDAFRQLNVGPMVPQAVICLTALSVQKHVYIHKYEIILN